VQEATRARKARNITIINLGLAPWEAVGMGLRIEPAEVTVSEKTKEPIRKPVAEYVKAADASGKHGIAPDGDTWEEWLQTHRIELNEMTTPRFIEWLDRKMSEVTKDADGKPIAAKLIPPEPVIKVELEAQLENAVRAKITERILREAKLDRQVKAAMKQIKRPAGRTLIQGIKGLFKIDRAKEWRNHITNVVAECLKKVT
jgi:hypothetical protein